MLSSANGSIVQLQAAASDAQADAAAAGAAASGAEQELRNWQAEAALCQRQIRQGRELNAASRSRTNNFGGRRHGLGSDKPSMAAVMQAFSWHPNNARGIIHQV